VATGAGSVWVANAQGGTVSQVDPNSLRVVRTLRVGGEPRSLAVAGGHLYVGDGRAQTVRSPYPAPASQVLGIGTEPRALLAVGGSVWVAGADPGRVLSVSAR
jgi:YVTN family beta-propeller protein